MANDTVILISSLTQTATGAESARIYAALEVSLVDQHLRSASSRARSGQPATQHWGPGKTGKGDESTSNWTCNNTTHHYHAIDIKHGKKNETGWETWPLGHMGSHHVHCRWMLTKSVLEENKRRRDAYRSIISYPTSSTHCPVT